MNLDSILSSDYNEDATHRVSVQSVENYKPITTYENNEIKVTAMPTEPDAIRVADINLSLEYLSFYTNKKITNNDIIIFNEKQYRVYSVENWNKYYLAKTEEIKNA